VGRAAIFARAGLAARFAAGLFICESLRVSSAAIAGFLGIFKLRETKEKNEKEKEIKKNQKALKSVFVALRKMSFDTFWGRVDLAQWRVNSLSQGEKKFLPSQRRLEFNPGTAGRDLIELAKAGDLHGLQLLVEVGADVNATDELGYASARCVLSHLCEGSPPLQVHAVAACGSLWTPEVKIHLLSAPALLLRLDPARHVRPVGTRPPA
jgi:hypothetical protein